MNARKLAYFVVLCCMLLAPVAAAEKLMQPKAVASDTGGYVYIADTGKNRIIKTNQGLEQVFAQYTDVKNPSGLTVDSQMYVYVADTGNNRILKLNPGLTAVVASFTDVVSPVGVAIDTYGSVVVSDTGNNRIISLNPAMSAIAKEFKLVNKPKGIAVGSDGYIVVADTGNNRVLKITPSLANIEKVYGSGKGSDFNQTNAPSAICVEPTTGFIYVADTGNNRILKLTSSLQTLVAKYGLNSAGSGANQTYAPEGLAIDATTKSENKVYVADTGNNRVFRIDFELKGIIAQMGAPTKLSMALDKNSITLSEGDKGTVKATVKNTDDIPQKNIVLTSSSTACCDLSISPAKYDLNPPAQNDFTITATAKSVGTYSITLTAKSDEGGVAVATLAVSVQAAKGDDPRKVQAATILATLEGKLAIAQQAVSTGIIDKSKTDEISSLMTQSRSKLDAKSFDEALSLAQQASTKMDALQQSLTSAGAAIPTGGQISMEALTKMLPKEFQDLLPMIQGAATVAQSVTKLADTVRARVAAVATWVQANAGFLIALLVLSCLIHLLFFTAALQTLFFVLMKGRKIKVGLGVFLLTLTIILFVAAPKDDIGKLILPVFFGLILMSIFSIVVFYLADLQDTIRKIAREEIKKSAEEAAGTKKVEKGEKAAPEGEKPKGFIQSFFDRFAKKGKVELPAKSPAEEKAEKEEKKEEEKEGKKEEKPAKKK